jgi:predicted CoA-binding protein|tara:strand:+ start:240 stop:635 length:396 start_codon:yes stop_codon:yes gene_type:complete
MNSIKEIKNIFQMKTIAVVGMSPKPERPSHYVAMYMKEQGYNIIPVNPGHNEISGMKSFPSLLDIPQTIDVVDVFRRSEYVLPIVESAVTVGAKALWLQDGVINEDGSALAEKAGLLVVMNDCMLRRHQQM